MLIEKDCQQSKSFSENTALNSLQAYKNSTLVWYFDDAAAAAADTGAAADDVAVHTEADADTDTDEDADADLPCAMAAYTLHSCTVYSGLV